MKTVLGLHKELMKRAVPTGQVTEKGMLMILPQRDPSLTSQLAERKEELGPLAMTERYNAYMDACRKAPNASEGTKRKWRKAVGLE